MCKFLFGWKTAYLQLALIDEWNPRVFKISWWLKEVGEQILSVPKEVPRLWVYRMRFVVFAIKFQMLVFLIVSYYNLKGMRRKGDLTFPNLKAVNLRKTWIYCISVLSCSNACALSWFEIGFLWLAASVLWQKGQTNDFLQHEETIKLHKKTLNLHVKCTSGSLVWDTCMCIRLIAK